MSVGSMFLVGTLLVPVLVILLVRYLFPVSMFPLVIVFIPLNEVPTIRTTVPRSPFSIVFFLIDGGPTRALFLVRRALLATPFFPVHGTSLHVSFPFHGSSSARAFFSLYRAPFPSRRGRNLQPHMQNREHDNLQSRT